MTQTGGEAARRTWGYDDERDGTTAKSNAKLQWTIAAATIAMAFTSIGMLVVAILPLLHGK